MAYAVMVFIALLGLGAYKIDSNAYDRGWNTRDSTCVDEKNDELTVLNQENADLVNYINLKEAEYRQFTQEKDDETKAKIGKIRASADRAHDDYVATARMLVIQAKNSGKNKSYTGEGEHTSVISRREGTEGSKLTPETIYELERLSLNGDEAIVLLRSCADKYKALRK